MISPDPDGAASLKNRAVRLTYGALGLVSKEELGTTAGQTDAAWNAFAPAQAIDITYDSNRRLATRKMNAGATNYALVQASYDNRGRLDCVATRMNPTIYGSLPSSACTLGSAGSFGPDRINKRIYDNAGHVIQLQEAVGTTDAANERTMTYSNNSLVQTLKDAENNLTTFEYDGFDRWVKTRYPLPAKGSNASSTTDYEQALVYDSNNNVTSYRNRAGQTTALTYDNLDRPTLKNLPGTEPDVTYSYDNLDRPTSASQTGNVLSFTYDALSRNLTQAGPQGTVATAWDLADRRIKLTYPDGYFVNYDYLVTGEGTKVRENGATTGVSVLASNTYDNLGNRASTTFGNGVVQTYGYDPVSRLASLVLNFTGTTNDLTLTYAYNPASQIISTTRSNDLYAWTGHGSGSTATVTNGLNQITSVGGVSATHDANGNLTTDSTTGTTFTYDSQNQLKTASGTTPPTLTYDPAGRLWELAAGTGATRYAYDGLDALTQQDPAGTLFRRHVSGPATDEKLVQYEGLGATTRRFLATDERGSVIATSDDGGNVISINAYDEYGVPQAGNATAFQYTGQLWQSLLSAYSYKLRTYEPKLGRFMQPDPIGYAGDAPNLYAYVTGDPVNRVDPFGLDDIVIVAPWIPINLLGGGITGSSAAPAYQNNYSYSQAILINGSKAVQRAQLLPSLPRNNPAACDPAGCDKGVVITKLLAAAPSVFLAPTNPPQLPPTNLPPGHSVRIMRPSAIYPNGYWRQYNQFGQAVDPSTGKPPANVTAAEFQARTHVPLPANPAPAPLPWFIRYGPVGIILYGLGIIDPAPAN